MSMMKEFKEFAVKGNVVDMAVGIVIGGAFGKIVSGFVSKIVMPPVGLMMGGVDFSKLAIVLKEKTAESEAVTIQYGAFINTVLDFIIVAFAIFLVVKQMNKLKKPAPAAAPTTKDCNFCFSKIALQATKCPNCTSDLG